MGSSQGRQYLDARGDQWFNFDSAHRGKGTTKTSCVSCHSLLSYALARPVLRRISNEKLPTKLETRLLEQTKSRVANWDKLDTETFQLMYDFDDAKKKQSRGTEAVLNALLLARDDRFQGRQEPSDDTKKALSILWATQITEGERQRLVGVDQFRDGPVGSRRPRDTWAPAWRRSLSVRLPGYGPGGTDEIEGTGSVCFAIT